MPSTIKELGIDRFSVENRLALVQEIWDSIAADVAQAPLTEAQQREVDRRLAAHRANPEAAVPWEQVEAEALARLRRGPPRLNPASLRLPRAWGGRTQDAACRGRVECGANLDEGTVMTPGAEQLLQSALALPAAEQVELVEALIAGLDEADPQPLDDGWMAEIRRRSAEFDAGKVTPVPWSVVRERARGGEGPRG